MSVSISCDSVHVSLEKDEDEDDKKLDLVLGELV